MLVVSYMNINPPEEIQRQLPSTYLAGWVRLENRWLSTDEDSLFRVTDEDHNWSEVGQEVLAYVGNAIPALRSTAVAAGCDNGNEGEEHVLKISEKNRKKHHNWPQVEN